MNLTMKVGDLASIAVAALVMPALAQQQQTQPPAQSGAQQLQGQNQTSKGSQQGRNQQISPRQLNESQVKQLQQALDAKGYNERGGTIRLSNAVLNGRWLMVRSRRSTVCARGQVVSRQSRAISVGFPVLSVSRETD
jgi:hypothetical protein